MKVHHLHCGTMDPHGEVRFRSVQWAHGPKIVEHDPDGEQWHGFAAPKELDAISPGIVLVSLPGHTRGHACVAVDAGHRWVHGRLRPEGGATTTPASPSCTPIATPIC